LFEFERSRNTLLFHFLLSQLLASVPSRPFRNCSCPLSQWFLCKAKQFQYDFRGGFFSLHLSQHQYGGRSLCQRSSPEAVLIQRLGSCQRKQRGEKQQKVAPCSSSEKRVTAEQNIALRHVFSPFSTQQQKLQLPSSPWHHSPGGCMRFGPLFWLTKNTPRGGESRQGSCPSVAQLVGDDGRTTLLPPHSSCPALPQRKAW